MKRLYTKILDILVPDSPDTGAPVYTEREYDLSREGERRAPVRRLLISQAREELWEELGREPRYAEIIDRFQRNQGVA